MELWSNPITFVSPGAPSASYDFSTNFTQAFSDGSSYLPEKLIMGTWTMYSGDIDHDGGVGILDAAVADNDGTVFFFGYNDDCINYPFPGSGSPSTCSDRLGSDCDGDGGTGILDQAIIENNGNLFLFYQRPF